MNRKSLSLTILAVLSFAFSTAAHPLGNFSMNQYSRLEVGKSQIKLREVLDMAEIPTFQESVAIDTDRDGKLSQAELNAYASSLTPQYLANLRLTVNGEAVPVKPISSSASLGVGAGDLSTLRIVWDLIAELPSIGEKTLVKFQNNNYTERVGWNEVVIAGIEGVNIFDTSSYGNGVTDELKNYPQEAITAPLAERSAEFSLTTTAIPGNAKPLQNRDGRASTPVQQDKFAQLIAVRELTPAIALFSLLLAFGFGAMHAMSPGHGKTVVGAYLVGSKGTIKHAIFLGLTVTVTHTLGVFAIGLITLFASNYILPERIMPFLTFVSGLLVFFIGASLFKNRLFAALGWTKNAPRHHDHDDGHEHTHDESTHTHGGSTHTHLPPEKVTWRSLLGLGISGGLLPCPSALVLMLSAISLGRIGYGLILTVVFSFGLAATLTTVGLIFLYAGRVFVGTAFAQSRLFKVLPVLSAFVIASVGAVICYSSLG